MERRSTPRTEVVIILSTSATVGSEGRASAAYEESKGGLMNLLTLQGRYFAEEHGLILNGLAPSPLRGPGRCSSERALRASECRPGVAE